MIPCHARCRLCVCVPFRAHRAAAIDFQLKLFSRMRASKYLRLLVVGARFMRLYMNRRMRAVAKYYFLIEGVRKWLDKLGAVSPGMRLSKCYRYKSQTCHNNANQKFRKPHSSTFVCVSPSAVRDQSIRGRPSSAFSIEHHHNQSYLFRVEEGWMSLSLSLTRCLCIYIYYIKFSFLAVLANMRDDKVRLKSDD